MLSFDKFAKNYDSWYLTKLGKFVDVVESKCAFELFNVYPGMKVLDIGCGTKVLDIINKYDLKKDINILSTVNVNLKMQKSSNMKMHKNFYSII